MREVQEFPESNGVNDAVHTTYVTSDISNVSPMEPADTNAQGIGSDDPMSDNVSTKTRRDNASNPTPAASRNDGTEDVATAGLAGKAPRNVVLVNHDKKRAGREVAIVILCVAIVILILLLCLRFFACSSDAYDPDAKEGMLPTKTEEEIQEEMGRKIEEGMFSISIYSVIRFPDGASEGEANIANVPNNNFDMQVTITEDATGDVLYESGIIKPNSYVDRIKLNKDLGPGTYDATAAFRALDRETHEERGTTNIEVAIYVEG